MNLVEDSQVRPIIGIITALPKEYAAVKVLLESQRPVKVRIWADTSTLYLCLKKRCRFVNGTYPQIILILK